MGSLAAKLATLLLVFACGLASLGAASECDARSSQWRSGGDANVTSYQVNPVVEWSPDGTRIVLGLKPWMYISDTDGSSLQSIPQGPSAYWYFEKDAAPDISPDGFRVAYNTYRYSTGPLWNRVHSYEIATSRLDGTDLRRLTKDEYGDLNPVWSPDRTRIAFMSDRGQGPGFKVYSMAADGSAIRRLTPVEPVELGVTYVSRPAWSPDGRLIAFVARTIRWKDEVINEAQHFIATVGPDGSNFRKLVQSKWPMGDPIWHPNNGRLTFARLENKDLKLFTVDPDGDHLETQIYGPRSLVEDSDYVPADYVYWEDPPMAWSPNGSELLFITRHIRKPHIFIISADGSASRRLNPTPSGEGFDYDSRNIYRASWSPDGSRIAVLDFHKIGDSRQSHVLLFTMAADGTDKKALVRWFQNRLKPENSDWLGVSEDIAACSQGEIVPDPDDNSGLVQDCETLLKIRNTLAGEANELRWNRTTLIRNWTGVILRGDPLRVTEIILEGGIATVNGAIPPEIGELTALKELMIVRNQVSGEIPPEIANLPELEILWLFGNQLTGNIPPELGNALNLSEIRIYDNDLTGNIPPELAKIPNLIALGVGENNFTGCIPAGLAENPALAITTELPSC